MDRVQRLDRGTVRGRHMTAQGFLRLDGIATRTGVLVYRNADGTERRELRLAEDVGRADSLESLRMVPVTDGHPPAMLTPANAKDYSRGTTGPTVTLGADGLVAVPEITITDAGLIAKVESGAAQELSCGYDCDLELTPGELDGERYDAIQRNIVYNHLAVVPRGRAGSAARLRMDSAAAELDQEHRDQDEDTMNTITINGVTYEVTAQVAQALAAQQRADAAQLDTVTGERDGAREQLAAEKSRADKAEGERDQVKSERQDGVANLPALVKARVALQTSAAKVLPAETVAKFDSMTDRQVREAVVLAVQPGAQLEGKSDDYVAARFDTAIETAGTATNTAEELAGVLAGGQQRADAGDEAPHDKARREMVERARAGHVTK